MSKLMVNVLYHSHCVQKTILAILDTMNETVQGEPDKRNIHFSILESDCFGRLPNHPNFNKKSTSCLHTIAVTSNKVSSIMDRDFLDVVIGTESYVIP